MSNVCYETAMRLAREYDAREAEYLKHCRKWHAGTDNRDLIHGHAIGVQIDAQTSEFFDGLDAQLRVIAAVRAEQQAQEPTDVLIELLSPDSSDVRSLLYRITPESKRAKDFFARFLQVLYSPTAEEYICVGISRMQKLLTVLQRQGDFIVESRNAEGSATT